jgi:hypothetical protein
VCQKLNCFGINVRRIGPCVSAIIRASVPKTNLLRDQRGLASPDWPTPGYAVAKGDRVCVPAVSLGSVLFSVACWYLLVPAGASWCQLSPGNCRLPLLAVACCCLLLLLLPAVHSTTSPKSPMAVRTSRPVYSLSLLNIPLTRVLVLMLNIPLTRVLVVDAQDPFDPCTRCRCSTIL